MRKPGLKSITAALAVAVMLFETAAGWVFSSILQTGGKSNQSEDWRKHPPAPGPIRPFRVAASRLVRLANGLTLVFVEDHRAPIVTIDIGIRAGEASDPAGMPGLAEATAHLLTEGAGALSSQQLAREVELLGGRLSSSAAEDYAEVSISVLAENCERMIEIGGDVVIRPSFPEDEVALYKNNRIQNLTVQRQDPAFLAGEYFNKIVYGPHPYSISAPTPESVASMNRARIAAFYKDTYGPAGSCIVIVGDFEPARMEAKARSVYESWKPKGETEGKPSPLPPDRQTRGVYLVDRPDSDQADIRIGNLAIDHAAADYIPLTVANAILGAGTSSRLFLDVREQKGYAYDVSSSAVALRQYGTFFGSTEARNEVVLPAIKEMLAEFDRMRNEKVSPDDLQSAKSFISGLFSLRMSTQGGVAGQILDTHMLGLGEKYLESYRERIEAVTDQQVQQVARKYILSDRVAIVVVGDATKLRKQLESLGPVEVMDAAGKKVNG